MKNLVYGGILMLTGMLGIFTLLVMTGFAYITNSSTFLAIFIIIAVLFAILAFYGFWEYARPAMRAKDDD